MKLSHFFSPILVSLCVISCGHSPKEQTLMPTPAVYLSGELHPFKHLPDSERSAKMEVFFATNRKGEPPYTGDLDKALRYGVAEMEIGRKGESWNDLVEASTIHPRPEPMPIRVLQAHESGDVKKPDFENWLKKMNRSIERTESKDLVIYVHGAKVGFEHSTAFAAELKHFSGRDVTAFAFDWPTHREIFSYVDGVDVSHARVSALKLADTLQLLASGTKAKKIHIVSWSAGARVLSRGLEELSRRGRDFNLGAVVFAAGDVPQEDFVKRLPAIHGLAERVMVYVSDNDGALKWSPRFLGGGKRLGRESAWLGAEQSRLFQRYPNLEVIDTSYGKVTRGFDIEGHRYWFQHPWVNSDLVIALRTDRPAQERGLKPGPMRGLFYFAPEYEKEIGKVAAGLTGGTW